MRIDVLFSPGAIATVELAGRTVVVLDVLRATTVMAVDIFHLLFEELMAGGLGRS